MTQGVHIEIIDHPDPHIRMGWLDALKVVAAFAVVMTHIASIGWQAMNPASRGWFVTSFFEIVTRFAVPVFFMATGALLLNPKRCLSLRRIMTSYVLKTALIALIASFLFSSLERALLGWLGWRAVLRATLDGPYFIWYLWVLIGLYLLMPVLRLVTRDFRMHGYFLGVLFFFVMVKSTFEAMLPESSLTLWFGNFILFTSGMEGVFYALLGSLMVRVRLSGCASALLIGSGTLCLGAAVALNYENALIMGADLYYVARDNVLIAAFSVGVFELFRVFFRRQSDSWEPISRLSGLGLAIYLVHPFFRLLMESLDLFAPAVNWLFSSPGIAVPFVSLAIWAASAAVGYLLAAVEGAADSLGRTKW